jgi:hypothetical protein
MFTIILGILLFLTIIVIIILSVYLSKCDAQIATLAPTNIIYSLLSEFIYNNQPNVLDLQKIQSCKFDPNGNYYISNSPIYLKDGLLLYSDPKLEQISEKDIMNKLDQSDTYKFKYSIQDILSMKIDTIKNNKNDPIFSQDIKMHLQDITEYLKHNSSDEEIQDILNNMKKIGQYVDNLINDINDIKIKTTNIYSKFINWVKFIISRGGGLDAILESIRPTIKQQFYLDMISLSTKNANNYSSGQCSLPPYQLWQKCPDNTIPTGSQGYKNQYCNKWYQKFSGTLLCSSSSSTSSFDTLDSCKKIANAIKNFKNIDAIFNDPNSYKSEIIKLIVHAIQTSISGIPQAVIVTNILTSIFHNFLQTYQQIEGILADLQDVCNSFSCANDSCQFDPIYVKTILSRQCSLNDNSSCPPSNQQLLSTLQLNKKYSGIGNFAYF